MSEKEVSEKLRELKHDLTTPPVGPLGEALVTRSPGLTEGKLAPVWEVT